MLPRPVDRAEAFLIDAGHSPLQAAGMALSLLPDAPIPAQARQQVRPYRHLRMTGQEKDQLARSLLSRRVLAEGMLLSLDGEDVRESAVASAHRLCEARMGNGKLSLQIGGGRARLEQVLQARARLVGEIGELDLLIEAATKDKNTDLSMSGAGAKANPRVVHLQNRLNTLGHRVLPDGVFGPMTDEAVKDFQTNAGLPANGTVDAITADSLRRGGRIEVDAGPGLAPGQQPPAGQQAAGEGDGAQGKAGEQPAEKSEGESTASKEKSDAKKADSTTKKAGKSVSVNVKLNEAIGPIKKGAFHAWLGKKPDEAITDADIAKGIAAGGHPAKMARFAKSARKFNKTQEAAGVCGCGAPEVGHGVCQRGHRIEETWSEAARRAAAAARKRLPHRDPYSHSDPTAMERLNDEVPDWDAPDEDDEPGNPAGKAMKDAPKVSELGRLPTKHMYGPHKHMIEADVMICECGAPVRGSVCQRGHRLLTETWSPQARAAAAAARKFKKGDRVKIKSAWGDLGTVQHDEREFRNEGDPNASEPTLSVMKDGLKAPLVYRKSELELAEAWSEKAREAAAAARRGKGTGVKKNYYVMQNIGKARHVINFHDGVKTHDDGSPFYDMHIANNKPDRDKFVAGLQRSGYVERDQLSEADAKADVCPECGARMVKPGVCQRGHRTKKLMEATFEQMQADGLL